MNCILFYSTKCDSCKSFIKILNNENLINIFKCINVDKINIEKLSKMGIKNVPTIIIKGQNGVSSLYECINAFTWLDNIIKYRRSTLIKKNNDIQLNIIDGYKTEELNGISDQYAYLQTDVAQPKSFLPYGKDDQYRIMTIPTNMNDKLDSRDQQELIDKLETIRNSQTNELKNIMEKNQLEIINNKI